MRMRRSVVVLIGAMGCAQPTFHRVPAAPHLAPTENALIVERPPSGAVLLGTVNLELSIYQLASDCLAQALTQAKQAGATHVVLPPATPGTSTRGPRCTAQAYYVPAR
jgi:hypothetical protein